MSKEGKGGTGKWEVAEAADWLHRERGHGGVQKMTEEGDGPGPGRGIFGDDAGSDGGRRAPTHPGDVWVSTVVLIGGYSVCPIDRQHLWGAGHLTGVEAASQVAPQVAPRVGAKLL